MYIYFVPLCLIVLIVTDCMVYLDPKFVIFKKYQKFWVRVNHTIRHNQKTKKQPNIISEARAWLLWPYVITKGICKKNIEISFCVGCMVWPWLRLFVMQRPALHLWKKFSFFGNLDLVTLVVSPKNVTKSHNITKSNNFM